MPSKIKKTDLLSLFFLIVILLASIIMLSLHDFPKQAHALDSTNLGKFVQEQIDQGHASQIGVYVYDFKTGQENEVNSNAQFIPASLLKLPLLMAFYKQAEDNPNLLTE